MPVSNPVVSAATLAAGIRANFIQTYDSTFTASLDKLQLAMRLGVPAKARTETEAYFETAPYPEFWPYGSNIPHGNFLSVSYQVTSRRYAKRVSWNEDDRKDDQTRKLMDRARVLGANFGTAHERAFFDLLLGTTNFIPSVPNAPDGAGFFATTAAGSDRFGISNGNQLTGNEIDGVFDIHQDYYAAISQFLGFLDTEGEPMIDESIIDAGVLIIHAANEKETFERAFSQNIVISSVDTATSNAGVSNIVKDANRKVKTWATSRITDNDWFIFLTGHPLKPTAQYELEGLQTNDGNRSNSDFTRDSGEEYFQAYMRSGYSINQPFAAMQINNG